MNTCLVYSCISQNDCEEGDHDFAFCSMHCSLESGKASCRTAAMSGAVTGNHCRKPGIATGVNKQDSVPDGRISQISVKLEKETPHDQQRLLQSPCLELKGAKQERLLSPEKRTVVGSQNVYKT